MRTGFQISNTRAVHMQLNAVAIAVRLGGYHVNFAGHFELAHALQGLAQDVALVR